MLAARRRPQLSIVSLEDRTVPAINLTITGGPDYGDTVTTNVTVDSATTPGTTIFTASTTGAVLDVDAIEAALNAGNVVIDTGTSGSEAGDITWMGVNWTDDLDCYNSDLRALGFRTNGGAFLANYAYLEFSDNVDLTIDTTGATTDGPLQIIDDAEIDSAHGVILNAGTNNITLETDWLAASGGNVHLTAGTIATGPAMTSYIQSDSGNVVFNAKVDLTAQSLNVRAHNGTVSFNGAVDGGLAGMTYLDLSANTMAFNAPVGGTSSLYDLSLGYGDAHFGNNPITSQYVDLWGATLGAGSGTVTASVSVNGGAAIAPGGTDHLGTMTVVGDVTFSGGNLIVDTQGATADQLDVTGNLTISGGNLILGQTTGALTGAVPVIRYTGARSGTFDNAPHGKIVPVGTDAIVAIYGLATGPADVTIAPAPALPSGTPFAGTQPDGAAYSVKLTGGGELVGGTNSLGQPFVVVRNSTPSSKLTVTTMPNASGSIVQFDKILVNGPLNSLAAPQADINGLLRVTGAAKSVGIHDLNGGTITLGGAATDKTTLTASSLFWGTVTATGALSSLAVTGEENSDLTAAAIGTLKVGDAAGGSITTAGAIGSITSTSSFQSNINAASIGPVKVGGEMFGQTWNVTGNVASISAQSIYSLGLAAKSLGAVSTSGSKDGTASGNISWSNFSLTGNDGSAKQLAVKSMSAAGGIYGTSLAASAGGVGPVKANAGINGGTWTLSGPIASMSAADISSMTVTARSIGSLTATSSKDGGFTGSISGCSFTLTGDDGSAKHYAVKSVTTSGELSNNAFSATTGGVGTVKVGADLTGNWWSSWNLAGGVASITAREIGSLTLTAKYLGNLTTTGAKDGSVSGDIVWSTFNFTGDDGSSKHYGLKSLSAAGDVRWNQFTTGAGDVGTVAVGGGLMSDTWNVAQGFGSITAQDIDSENLTARNLGTLMVNGSKDGMVSGDVTNSTIILTGDDGSSKHYGIKSAAIAGNVDDTFFDVRAGNVDTFTVGRFLDSNLYLNYAPGGDFTTGSFNSVTAYKLNKFTTTATTIGDATNYLNWAFAGSRIAADTLGTVRLSGLNTTYWTPCGIKFRSAGGSVQVASAGPDAMPLNTNLTANTTAIAGAFYYLDV